MATQTTLLSGLSLENKEFYDKVLIKEANANLVHDQFGQKRPIPKGGGKKIEFRKFASLPKATTALTEGTTPNGQNLTVTHVEADIAQYGDYVQLSDMLELTAIDNVIVETTRLLGNQAGLTIDTIVRDILNAGNNIVYADKIVSGAATAVSARTELDATAALTVDTIQRAVAKLRKANAPTFGDGYYVGIIHPYVAYDLMKDPMWINTSAYSNPEQIYKGEIGKIAGVRFVESSEAKVFSGTGAPSGLGVFSTLILGRDAYGSTEIEGGGMETIIKQKGYGEDPLNQRSSIGWKATKTAAILVDPYIVRCESCSPRYSSTTTAN